MPSCGNCGNELPEDAAYCPKCGMAVQATVQPRLAYWGERFLAWLIDVAILWVILAPINLLAWLGWPGLAVFPSVPSWIPFVNFGVNNVVYFVYWMFMEGFYGRSLGKMVMRIRVARLNGERADIWQAALESIGKAFLLPLDIILGLILYPRKRQRLFNYLSGTIVLKG